MYVFSLMQIYEIYNIVENVLDYLQLGCTKKGRSSTATFDMVKDVRNYNWIL